MSFALKGSFGCPPPTGPPTQRSTSLVSIGVNSTAPSVSGGATVSVIALLPFLQLDESAPNCTTFLETGQAALRRYVGLRRSGSAAPARGVHLDAVLGDAHLEEGRC